MFYWFSEKIDDTTRCIREILAGKRKFCIVSEDEETIADSDEYGEKISADIQISDSAPFHFFMRFSLEQSCEIDDTYIDR